MRIDDFVRSFLSKFFEAGQSWKEIIDTFLRNQCLSQGELVHFSWNCHVSR